jgi:hypothetical protein
MKSYGWLLLLFSFSACNDLVNTEKNTSEDKKSISRQERSNTNSDADILNNISLYESGGLHVARAYLTFENGKLVPKSNEVPLKEPVYLNLVIKQGWKNKEGQASIDAAETITTHNGEIVLNAPSLFKSKPMMDASDANRILLKATITKTRPDIAYFIVNYRVWDKWSDAEVKGSYRLYMTDPDSETE